MTLNELYQQAVKENVEIDYFNMREVEAFSMPNVVVINPKTIKSETDEKIKIAHELGHCATCSFYNINNPLDVIGKHERKATVWAIKKTRPRGRVRKRCC